MSCEHGEIISALREATTAHRGVDFMPNARVTSIFAQKLTFENGKHSETQTIFAERIIGADGRASLARKALGIPNDSKLVSYMAGVLLEDVELPFEGFGHVFLGGPGPVLAYRIGKNQVRICLDVPLYLKKKPADLWDAYSLILPSVLLKAFRKALENSAIVWAANQYSSRTHYGREGLALVGDATGYFHPITATGMTIGFMDAECLVKSKNFEDYQRQRSLATYVPEMLATTLYEVFCRDDDSAIAIRKAIYKIWRQNPIECRRTMWLLSGAETNLLHFSESFLKAVAIAIVYVIKDNASKYQWRHMIQILATFGQWLRSPIAIALSRLNKHKTRTMKPEEIKDRLSTKQDLRSLPTDITFATKSTTALQRAVRSLISLQQADGSWEGEVVWCPMLPAQYVLMCHITQTPISWERREAILQQFQSTRLPSSSPSQQCLLCSERFSAQIKED